MGTYAAGRIQSQQFPARIAIPRLQLTYDIRPVELFLFAIIPVLNSASGTQGRMRQTRQDGRLRLAGLSHRFRDRVKWAHWTRVTRLVTGTAAQRHRGSRVPDSQASAFDGGLVASSHILR